LDISRFIIKRNPKINNSDKISASNLINGRFKALFFQIKSDRNIFKIKFKIFKGNLSKLPDVLSLFSIYSNSKALLNSKIKEDEIFSLHFIRFFSLVFVDCKKFLLKL